MKICNFDVAVFRILKKMVKDLGPYLFEKAFLRAKAETMKIGGEVGGIGGRRKEEGGWEEGSGREERVGGWEEGGRRLITGLFLANELGRRRQDEGGRRRIEGGGEERGERRREGGEEGGGRGGGVEEEGEEGGRRREGGGEEGRRWREGKRERKGERREFGQWLRSMENDLEGGLNELIEILRMEGMYIYIKVIYIRFPPFLLVFSP